MSRPTAGSRGRYYRHPTADGVGARSPRSRPGSRGGGGTVDASKALIRQTNGSFDVDRVAAEVFAGRAGKTIRRFIRTLADEIEHEQRKGRARLRPSGFAPVYDPPRGGRVDRQVRPAALGAPLGRPLAPV